MKFGKLLLIIVSLLSCQLFADKAFMPANFWDSMQFNQVRKTEEALVNDPLFAQIEKRYDDFCNEVHHHSTDYLAVPKSGLIPPIIHFIWLGSSIPPEAQSSIDSWKILHPGWEIKVWTDDELNEFTWTTERTKTNFYDAVSFAEKADILRCEILYQFGGIYSDTDVICLKPFHDIIASNVHFFAAIEVNYIHSASKKNLFVGTAILGAVKGSETMKYYLEHHIGIKEQPSENILNRTGPGLCTQAIKHSIEENEEDVLLLPISYFYPFPFYCRHLSCEKALSYQAPETMAIHLWQASWLSPETLETIKQKSISSGYVPAEDQS